MTRAHLAAIGVTLALALLPSGVCGQTAHEPPERSDAWAAISKKLKLNPVQQAALDTFVSKMTASAEADSRSAEQIQAMTFLERFDYVSAQMSAAASNTRTTAVALHKFYGSLSAEQRKGFDEATTVKTPPASVAADAVTYAAPETPDLKLPAHTEPNWLIKPTAENISRVYPAAAVQNHLSGKVILACIADEDGYLTECVVRSETPKDQGFGNAALEITAYMRMQPATNFGVPVRAPVNVPIAFSLDDQD